jgi:predicted metal-dependent phosphoesterase TrpH
MTILYADLHTHTTASDGTNSPSANVRMAAEAGLAAVAITDHDTVSGIREALEEGTRIGIRVVPGVEISTVANGQDIHVLGYFIDYEDESFLRRLEELRRTRDRRNEMLIERLRELGVDISMEEVLKELEGSKSKDDTIGRPHIAAVLVKKGYAASIQEAFERYLGKQGAAYVNPPRIGPTTAVEWIREAGGAAVLAHPGLYDDDKLVMELIAFGIDGIEAYHSDHSPEDEEKYARLAQRHGLLITAGSDFHGERNGQVFHAPIGARKIDAAVIDRLLESRVKSK